jgi:glyoxylase-like metal-dependent hydrolase (beta-lactamase superfamily II)
MIVTRANDRCLIFSFDDIEHSSPTNVVAIDGREHVVICDTYLGPDCMAEVMRETWAAFEQKPVIVFNSHGDWDHHWGNCYFENLPIIAHEQTARYIEDRGAAELEENAQYQRGEITITLPTVTFEDEYRVPGEDILFFHSPGHTADSSSCLAREARVLYAGDNVEVPIPYLNSPDVDRYIRTLQHYLELELDVVVPGHGTIVASKNLVRENIDYLERLRDRRAQQFERGPAKNVHLHNLGVICGCR